MRPTRRGEHVVNANNFNPRPHEMPDSLPVDLVRTDGSKAGRVRLPLIDRQPDVLIVGARIFHRESAARYVECFAWHVPADMTDWRA
jgi:hypothetical protein